MYRILRQYVPTRFSNYAKRRVQRHCSNLACVEIYDIYGFFRDVFAEKSHQNYLRVDVSHLWQHVESGVLVGRVSDLSAPFYNCFVQNFFHGLKYSAQLLLV